MAKNLDKAGRPIPLRRWVQAIVAGLMVLGVALAMAPWWHFGQGAKHKAPQTSAVYPDWEKRLSGASALLYAEGDDGELHMFCTATAYARADQNIYRFVTSSYCVTGTEDNRFDAKGWFLSLDGKYYKATVIRVEEPFATLETKLDHAIPIGFVDEDGMTDVPAGRL